MNQVRIAVTFGLSNRIEKTFPAGTTIRSVIADPQVKSGLGYPSNVKPLIHRVDQSQSLDAQVQDGDEIVLETVGTSKAS
jgi:hypothetical protein